MYFSPVGEGLWEIAARAWHDPKVHAKSKVSWGVPVDNAHVESHFTVRTVREGRILPLFVTWRGALFSIETVLASWLERRGVCVHTLRICVCETWSIPS